MRRVNKSRKQRIYAFLLKSSIFCLLLRIYRRRTSPVCIVSFKKSGRTWLNLLIGKAISLHFSLNDDDCLSLPLIRNRSKGYPGILFSHDDAAHWKKPDELIQSSIKYKYKKVIFLARDPRDILVSTYYEKTKRLPAYIEGEKLEYKFVSERIKPYEGTLSDYLYESVGSYDTILSFYNIWAENSKNIDDFLLVSYENLYGNPQKELRKVLNFIGLLDVSDEVLSEAIEYASFRNMRSMEQNDRLQSMKLRPAQNDDFESYKTRSGKVGGFVDYFNEEEIEYLNSKMKETLSDFYKYNV